jgi:MFS family permease
MPIRHVVAVVLGNGLEFYDFLSFAIFAVYISKAFFPFAHGALSLLLTLATFGVGFGTRPIGAIVLGTLGDRVGRKPAMLISFALIGTGMLGLALTPSFRAIGYAAPALAVLFRLVQSFALGGEVGPTTAYMIEAAPPERRGLYGSMQALSQNTAVLAASSVGVALSSILSPAALADWGWRVAFLLGVVIVPFGIFIRRTLPETLHAADDAALAPDATLGTVSRRQTLAPYYKLIVLGLAILASATIGTYVTDYMTTYSLDTLHLNAGAAFGVSVVTSLVAMTFDPISGMLSDRFGRRPSMILPGVIVLFMIIPGFWIIAHFRSVLVLYGTMAVITAFWELTTTPIIISLTESLPPRIRSGVVATVYAFAISIFGGSTQFTIKWLLEWTHSPLAPAWYWSGALCIGLLAMLFLPESAPVKLRSEDSQTTLGEAVRVQG